MCHRAAAAAGEHRETSLQPPGQLGRGHRGTRAAASSIASAIPSRRRTTAATAAAFSAVTAKLGLDRGRAFGEQPHRLRLGDRRQVGVGAGHRQRRHRHQPLPVDPEALAAGRQDHQPLTRPLRGPRPAPPPLRADARSCRAPAAAALPRRNSTSASRVLWPAGAVTENTAATASSTPAASRIGASSHSHAPSPNRGAPARRPAAPAGSCRPRPPRSRSPAAPRPAPPRSARAPRARPTKELTCNGRLPGARSGADRREVGRADRHGSAGR